MNRIISGSIVLMGALLAVGIAKSATPIDLSPASCGVQAPNCYLANDAGASVHLEGVVSGGVYLWLNGVEFYAPVPWAAIPNGVTLQSADGTSILLTGTFATHLVCFTGGRGAGCRNVISFLGGTIN